jgi:hypothetical protein
VNREGAKKRSFKKQKENFARFASPHRSRRDTACVTVSAFRGGVRGEKNGEKLCVEDLL